MFVLLWACALAGCAELGSTLVIGDQSNPEDAAQTSDPSDGSDPVDSTDPCDATDPSSQDDPELVWCRYHVTPDATQSGESWEAPATLATAIENLTVHLVSGECTSGEVWLTAGIYTSGDSDGDSFTLVSGMALYGGFSGNETTLSQRSLAQSATVLSGDLLTGGKSFHVVSIISQDSSEVRLDGLTVQGGSASGVGTQALGGGFYAESSRVRLVDVSFVSNEASNQGGGVYVQGGVLSVERARFVSNTAASDGGAIALVDATLLVTGLEMVSNTADRGGGLFMQNATEVRLENTQWLTQAARLGGAIFDVGAASFILNRADFQSNQGFESGGSIYLATTQAPLIGNAVFFGNAAPEGACLYADTVTLVTVAGVTMAGNVPAVGGNIEAVESSVSLANSILWDNQIETSIQGEATVTVSWSIAPVSVSGDNLISSHPLFVRAPGEVEGVEPDLTLQAGSPAIDSGNNDLIPEGLGGADAAGMGRRQDDEASADSGVGDAPIVDRGAFEK